MSSTWDSDLDELILLPRAAQYDALQRLRASHTDFNREEWNTAFGESSLYEAWTQLPFMQSLYGHNRDVIHGALGDRQDWHIVEIGGGNGVLWDGVFAEHRPGRLTLIDPHPEAHVAVAGRIPQHVVFNSIVEHVEAAEVPDADLVVCSLTLHHVAGLDAAQRASVGFEGVGKKEILGRIVSALRARVGTGIVNEADCYNEIDLAPSDPVLVDHFIDVYVRRTGRAIAHAMARPDIEHTVRDAWNAILQHWCLDQIGNALLPTDQRDVYELDVAHWLRLLGAVGARHVTHTYTDDWNLFQQYVFR